MRSTIASYAEATAWLAKHASLEHPTKMHDRAIGDDGAPRLSEAFIRWLNRDDPTEKPWAFETFTTTVDEPCPRAHPIRKPNEPRCEMCDDALSWKKTRPQYVRPFMAAMERLRHEKATSHDWPAPHRLILALLSAGGDVYEAATFIGHPVIGPDHRKTLEAAFLLAVRKLADRYASGPIPRMKWTELSDSQKAAQEAA